MTPHSSEFGLPGEGFGEFMRLPGAGLPSEPARDANPDRATVPSAYGDNGVYAEEPRATPEPGAPEEHVLATAPHLGAAASESNIALPDDSEGEPSGEQQRGDPEPLEPSEHPSETLAALGTRPEDNDPPYEMRETDTQTLLVSTNHPNPELVEEAAAALANGRSGWPKAETQGGTSARFYQNSKENPRFFVKSFGDDDYRQGVYEDLLYENMSPEQAREWIAEDTSGGGDELALAPDVATVINSDEIQAKARAMGFEDVRLVQPLLAGTNHETHENYVVYPFIDGEVAEELEEIRPLRDLGHTIASDLANSGIEARDWLGDFMITVDEGGTRHLHAIDISEFRRIPEQEVASELTEPHTDTVEQSSEPYETHETDARTILTSNVHPNRQLVETAAETLANGVPADWVTAPIQRQGDLLKVDNAVNPTLFVKSRGDAAHQQMTLNSFAEVGPSQTAEFLGDNTMAFAQGYVNVEQEMNIAPHVQRVTDSPGVQNIAHTYGFDSISVVMPLVAVTDKTTGERLTAYEWNPGKILAPQRIPQSEAERQAVIRDAAFARDLRNYFIANRINPLDLATHNIMVTTSETGAEYAWIIDFAHYQLLDD